MRSPYWNYALLFGLGVVATLLIGVFKDSLAPCHSTYDLLNPSRRCSDLPTQGEWNYEPVREALERKKAEWKATGALNHISIYFRDLDHGPRFGIGEYDQFQPASLMKVPILIFFLHAADFEPKILEKEMVFTDDYAVEDNVFKPEETMQKGVAYPIRSLLEKMIIHSDNRSYAVLLREMNALSEDVAYSTFLDLDILSMMLVSEQTFVSISDYARLFAVLYSTGYLSRDMSQYALQLLSDTTFKEGIAAGVPDSVRVAHKFGYVRIGGEGQLHDCGIVYHSKASYILCVFTTAQDENKANAAIKEVSHMVYDTVSELDLTSP